METTTAYEVTVEPTPEVWSTAGVYENGQRVGEEPFLSRKAGFEARINGNRHYGCWSTDEAKARKAAERAAARMAADDEVRPAAGRVCRTLTQAEADAEYPAGAPVTVGEPAAIYSRGRIRVGIVTKIGSKNIEVAYVTPTSPGNVTRKSAPANLVGGRR